MTQLLDTAPASNILDLATYAWRGSAPQTGFGAFLRANVAQGWWSTLSAQGMAQNDAARADDADVYLTDREWRASAEYREGLRFEPGLTRGRARFNAQLNDELRVREDVIQRRDAGYGEMALGFGAAIIGGLPTPENFIPFTGPAWRAAQIARYGSIGGRTVAGAADAALGTALVSPFVIASQQQFGDRVDFADALLDIAMGAAIGSMIGAGSGVLARWQGRDANLFAAQRAYAAAAQQLDEAAGALADGRPVRIDPGLLREVEALRGQVAELDAARQEALAAAEAARRAADASGRLADIGPGVEVRVRAGADSDITFAVRYEVVEADTLITSHVDETFAENPAFDQRLQNRDRSRDASIVATRKRASELDPAQLLASPLGSTGAPVVGGDNMVESGNGRTLSLRLAYREGMPGGQAYRDTLARLGFAIDGMREPVLIRRRIDEQDDATRIRSAVDMNRDVTERKTATEDATADARLLTPEIVGAWRPGPLTGSGNAGFVRAFIASLPAPEQAAMSGEGNALSADGLRRLERAVQAAAYADRALVSTLLEDPSDELNRLGRVLKAAAPSVLAWRTAVAEGRVIPQLDGTADLVAAAALIADARRKGRPLADLLNIPADMFGDGPTATTRLWLSLMLDRRSNGTAVIADPDRIAARVEAGRKLAEDSPQALDMLGNAPPTIRSVLATVHMRESVDLPFLPDAIRDFSDPAPRSLAGPPAEAPPPPRAQAQADARLAAAEAEPTTARPVTEEEAGGALEAIVNPIDRNANANEKLAQTLALTEENRPVVARIMAAIDAALGTESKDNVKDPEKILEKAARPSILARKPWHGVEHIRDSYRFKTPVERLDQVAAALEIVVREGVRLVKVDTAKLFAPGEWGWRIVSFDLRMPNRQMVEWYLPIRELEEAKDAGHVIFERWRNATAAEIQAGAAAYAADVEASNALYQAAFDAALSRMGFADEAAARASFESAMARSLDTLRKLSERSTATGITSTMAGSSGPTQAPDVARTQPAAGPAVTNTRPVSASSQTPAGLDRSSSQVATSQSSATRGDSIAQSGPAVPELDLIAAAIDDLARIGRLGEADAATLRAGNQAADQAEAMADGLEAAGACMIRTLL